MKYFFSITGLGICTAGSLNYEDHIEALVSGRVRTNTEMPENALERCVQEALDFRNMTDAVILADFQLGAAQLKALNLKEQHTCKDLAQMITDAQPFLKKNKAVLLLAQQTDGFVALLLETEYEKHSLARVSAQMTDADTVACAAEDLTTLLTAVMEVRFAMEFHGPEHYNHMRYWQIAREKDLKLGPVKLYLTEAEELLYKTYRTNRHLIPVRFRTVAEAQERLNRLSKECDSKSLTALMDEGVKEVQTQDKNANVIVFCVTSKEILKEEISQLLAQSARLLDRDFSWKSEGGSVYRCRTTADPKIVFMTPTGGSFIPKTYYPRYARLFQYLERDFIRAQGTMLHPSGNEFIDRYMYDVISNNATMHMLEGIGVVPDYLTGVSMGELSNNMTHMKSKSVQHNAVSYHIMRVFLEIMARGEEAATAYMGRKPSGLIKHYLMCEVDRVEEALKDYDSVFLTVKCSPQNAIIAGEPDACNRLIKQLGCVSMPLDDPNYIHAPVMEAFYEDLYRAVIDGQLYLDVDNLPFKLYSSFSCKPMDSSVESCARSFADLIVKQVDFVKTLNALYDDGGRVFVDLSSRQMCAPWSVRTLGQKSDFAVINTFEDAAPADYLLNIAVQLISSNIPFDAHKVLKYLSYEKDHPEAVTVPEPAVNTVSAPVASTVPDTCVACAAAPVAAEKMPVPADVQKAFEQVVTQQMRNNQQAFRMYMDAQNALYEQLLKNGTPTEGKKKVTFPNASKEYLFDRQQVITMTETSMAAVLGDRYKDVDQYHVRARMPLPPLLFVSRIISIDAEYGVFRPSSIVTEFDLDEDCVFRDADSRIGPLVASEASHIAIFLLAYMGLDAISKGTLSYRAIDSSMVSYSDRPYRVGDTLRTVLNINRFVKNGSTTLLFFTFESYNGDELISITEATGGFFTKADLASNKGVITPKKQFRKKVEPKEFIHYSDFTKTTYGKQELDAFFKGDYEGCFKVPCKTSGRDLYYLPHDLQMVDRVTNIDYNGGVYGRGFISGEKQITPDMWPFDVHFKNDPIFPAIIVSDGVTQLGMFLFAHSGLLSRFDSANFATVTGNRCTSKFRGQVRRGYSTLRYEISVREVVETENEICTYLDAAIFNDDVQIMQIDSYSLKLANGTK